MLKLWHSDALGSQMKQASGWLWLFSAAANVLMLASPLYMTQIYGRVIPSHGLQTLLWLTIIIVLAVALYGLVETVRSLLALKLGARYETTASSLLLNAGIDNPRGGAIAEGMRDAMTVRQSLSSRQYVGLFDLPFVPLFIGIAFLAHPALGTLTLVGGVVLVVLAAVNNQALGDTGKRSTLHQNQASRYAAAALDASEAARAMGMGPALVHRWEAEALQAARAADEAGSTNALFLGLTRFVRQGLQIGVLGLGGYLVLIGQMHAGLIFAASLLSGRALQPVEQLIGGWRQAQAGLAAHRRIEALLDSIKETQGSQTVSLPAPRGELKVDSAGLAILGPRGPQVLLQDITLEVVPGEILAIMGPSGAGKSTLARLMAGTATPGTGHVRLDGFDLEQWPAHQRGAAIGYLGQDTGLLDGTVAENIARFSPDADDREIVAAAQRAMAHEFIAQLPDGYATRLGAGGIRLSGGQAQRIGLARAFYGDPAVLILDEPNAHLDSDGERALIDALRTARGRNRSIVVVSQRNSVLSIADRVAIIKAGRLDSCRSASQFRAQAPGLAPQLPPRAANISRRPAAPARQGDAS